MNRHGAFETAFRSRCVSWKWTHIVEDVHPSLHGDTLENRENSEEDIVKVGDAKAGSDPVFLTDGAITTGPRRRVQATGEICCLLAYSHNTHKRTQTHTITHTEIHKQVFEEKAADVLCKSISRTKIQKKLKHNT